ncbi:hypothetical protein G6O69_29015 [Pseudenhygromyxa sp. WMMC2535]|uniref:hypothetical protein n=1 Tax=Pseudenhygromyxa sp. WMMC2535 TaxID=2712867 RepID=UPI001552E6DE|nr:hypothetical protein [Pseudenhygromyxa sp. WMMC2535]NVB41907.1 hypothetical protein [Pseudenhygromyxa sp. WMMC2535]
MSTASLDDDTHAALDRLDELELGRLWAAARSQDDPRTRAQLEAALAEHPLVEDPAEVFAAAERVRAGLVDMLELNARQLLAAARVLPEPSAATLGMAIAAIDEDPEAAAALAPAVELCERMLDLDREGAAWGELVALGERARAQADASPLLACSDPLDAALRSTPPSPAERVFRVAMLAHAGPQLRARVLSAEHPEHLELAKRLIAAHDAAQSTAEDTADPDQGTRDASELVAAFDHARTAHEAASGASVDEGPQMDGPKRRFTWLHATLAILVLGLTLWHYFLR